MTIVCGTDFSPRSIARCTDAAFMARTAKVPLVLVHAAPLPLIPGQEQEFDRLLAASRDDLTRIAKEIGDATGAEVVARLETGNAEEVIPAIARETRASMVVISATSRPSTRWLLGSTADRIVSAAEAPVFVLHEAFPLREWLERKRPLRVMVATDLSATSDNAVDAAVALSRYGDCTYTLAHISWPPEIYHRLGIEGPMPLDRTHPLADQVIRRELDWAAEKLRAAGECEIVIESSMGRPADSLNRIAAERKSDLLVVGHHADALWRVWEGSVARSVIRSARTSVVCVPDTDVPREMRVRSFDHVVAATDLSAAGNATLPWALAAAADGGRVTIVHVLTDDEDDPATRKSVADGLEHLCVGCQALERGITIAVQLLEKDDAAEAVCAFAEREGASLICIGSTGGSRIPRVLFGSVAQKILLSSRKPVMVIPPSAG